MRNSRTASFQDTDLKALNEWTEAERKSACLTVWVDMYFLQVALCPPNAAKKTIYLNPIKVSKASDVLNNFEDLRCAIAAQKTQIGFATMSFAGPITQDHVIITNWMCEARERVIHFTSLPFDLFPLDRRLFMNDLEAASYGIIARFLNGSLPKIFKEVWLSDPNAPFLSSLDGNSLVIWIGGGLGCSFISRLESADYNCVVSSEGSHQQANCLPPWHPDFERDREIQRFFSQKLHGESHQAEWEDFGSLGGLELAYQFCCKNAGVELRNNLRYDEIRNLAIKGDKVAFEAFKIHYTYIIRCIQSLCLTIRCKRVFIISEDTVKNYPLVDKLKQTLFQVFTDHPRAEWFKGIDVYTQVETSTFALSGGLFISKMFSMSHQTQSHVD